MRERPSLRAFASDWLTHWPDLGLYDTVLSGH